MDYITKKIGNAEFTFLLNSRSNRSGFVHECELMAGGVEIVRGKRQYYNRTWESYRYQSVMLDAVDNALEDARGRIVNREKAARGWNRLTQARRNEIGRVVDADDGVKVLRALRKEVSGAHYGTEQERKDLEALDALVALAEIVCGAGRATE